MKKIIALFFVAAMVIGMVGCASSKRSGYVSKYPCHKRHPCDH